MPVFETEQDLLDRGLNLFVEFRIDRDAIWLFGIALAFRPQPRSVQVRRQRAEEVDEPETHVETEVRVVEQEALLDEVTNGLGPIVAFADAGLLPIEKLRAAFRIAAGELEAGDRFVDPMRRIGF